MGKKGEQRLRWMGSNAAQAEYERAVAEANRKRQERLRREGRAKPRKAGKRARGRPAWQEFPPPRPVEQLPTCEPWEVPFDID